MTAEHPERPRGGTVPSAEWYLSVDDLLEIAQEQAESPEVLRHIREARQHTLTPSEVRER